VTIPADVRRAMGIHPGTRVQVEVRGNEIVLRPLPSVSELAGCLREYAVGKGTDFARIREEAMTIMAEEFVREHQR
jgi:AbrB family looped-hinge helix DNA binding protein